MNKVTVPVLAGVLALWACGLLTVAHAALDRDVSMAHSRAAVGHQVSDFEFVDTSMQTVKLSDFRGRPAIVSMIFTSCHHICPTLTSTLKASTDSAVEMLGESSFSVLTIGFDSANDTPARLKEYARVRGIDETNWHFLAADAATVTRLSEQLGFTFRPIAGGFDHVLQTTILDGEGRVARQVYGSSFEAPILIEPLRELLIGGSLDSNSLRGLVEGLKLFCTVFDPSSGRYRFDYSIIVAFVIGLACLGGVGYVLVGLWRAPST